MPHHTAYRPYYTRWYVHPWYRAYYSTWVVVSFDFVPSPWVVTWVPPSRPGWEWIPGYYDVYGYWVPGYWAPVYSAPTYNGVQYVYVPGWWQDDLYVEGYYRPEYRDDGDWNWVEGYYLEDGTYVPGHWEPVGASPDGYTWEPGFFDGETWIEGFWRPTYRAGFTWISAWYDEDGIFHTGYWEPTQANPGAVWIPGWFDGNQWVEGYWVSEAEYSSTDPNDWQPEAGWNDGWDPSTGELEDEADDVYYYYYDNPEAGDETHADVPLALPVFMEEDL